MNSSIEHAVIGLSISNPSMIPSLLSQVSPADMWDPKSEVVLSAVADLWAEGVSVDPLGVVQRLSGSQVTASEVFGMVEVACPPASLSHHVATLAENAAVRRLSAAGERIQHLASSGESSQSIVQGAQELIDGAIRANDSEVHLVGETLDETLERIRAAERGETESGLPTGLHDLDGITNGLGAGQMVIVAARPGVGKSTLAVDFMRHASIKQGVPSLMFSLEMGMNEVNQRILAAESRVPLTAIVAGSMDQDHWERVEQALPRIKDAPLFVDDSSETTITDISAKARMYVEKHNVGLIVVDYLQLLRSKDRMESREQEIATYSRQMKLLAKSCGVPVVVIAQLNRESVRRGGAPMVSDLRESGALEQDADVIMLIDRPEAADKNTDRMGEADIIVGKNRRGKTGTATVVSQLHYSRFANHSRALT